MLSLTPPVLEPCGYSSVWMRTPTATAASRQ